MFAGMEFAGSAPRISRQPTLLPPYLRAEAFHCWSTLLWNFASLCERLCSREIECESSYLRPVNDITSSRTKP